MGPRLFVIGSIVALSMILIDCASEGTTGTGSPCGKSADCAADGGAVCCAGECKQASSCGTCAVPPANLAGSWNWRFVCMDTTGACPVRDDTHVVTISQTSGSPSITATVSGSDDLAGVICNDEVQWLETGSGTDHGCWTLSATADRFNQRSVADGGQRLCLGVGARVGASLPAVPDCTALQAMFASGAGTFRVCPSPPPAAP